MSDPPRVLLVTTSVDAASDAVVDELRRMGPTSFYRLNTEDLPLNARSSIELGGDRFSRDWFSDGTAANFSDIRRVWYRRHRLPVLPKDTPPAHEEYCLRESLWFVRGLLLALGTALRPEDWMSYPAAVQAAESKILQLTVARSLSFACPDTLISNDPERIRSFFETHQGEVIAKPLRMGYFDYGHVQRATYTTALTADDLTDDGALAAAPVIYQKLIPKQCDIRITVVGDRVFGAAIDSQPTASARIDWRRADVELPHHVHDLPEGVQEACLQLMRRLGLVFGALDFVLTPDGEYVFLEVNASGQWLWLEDKLGFPIAREIACWLLRGASE